MLRFEISVVYGFPSVTVPCPGKDAVNNDLLSVSTVLVVPSYTFDAGTDKPVIFNDFFVTFLTTKLSALTNS